MQITRTATIVLTALGLLSGCAAVEEGFRAVFPQQQNVNLSLIPGTLAPHPAWIDGDPRSAGKSERIPRPPGRFESPPTEAVVLFPTERRIHKIVVHSDEIMALDLYFETASSGWVFNSRYAGQIGPRIVLDPKGLVSASGVKIRITEGVGDRKRRDEVLIRNGVYTEVRGETNVRVEIREIEILGPGPRKAPDPTAEIGETETSEEATTTPDELLRDGLLN